MALTGTKKTRRGWASGGRQVVRVQTCKLGLRGLEEEAAWIERHRQLWGRKRFDELDMVVEELKRKEKAKDR